MERYREERKPDMRRKKNMMHSQTIRSEELVVHFEHDLSTTGLCAVEVETKDFLLKY